MSEELRAIPGAWANPPAEMISKLPKGGDRDQKINCSICGGFHGKGAVHLDYMGHADITLALIEIDPLWSWAPAAIDPVTGGPVITPIGNRLVMWGALTLLGKTILGVGTCEDSKADPEKELLGDFLRNAGLRFGIGTKLWSKADRHQSEPEPSKPSGYDRPLRPASELPQPKPRQTNGAEGSCPSCHAPAGKKHTPRCEANAAPASPAPDPQDAIPQARVCSACSVPLSPSDAAQSILAHGDQFCATCEPKAAGR